MRTSPHFELIITFSSSPPTPNMATLGIESFQRWRRIVEPFLHRSPPHNCLEAELPRAPKHDDSTDVLVLPINSFALESESFSILPLLIFFRTSVFPPEDSGRHILNQLFLLIPMTERSFGRRCGSLLFYNFGLPEEKSFTNFRFRLSAAIPFLVACSLDSGLYVA